MLTVDTSTMGPVTVIRLKGNIDEDGATDLRIALVACLRENHFNVVVNLSEVQVVSFMGVGILVERLGQFQIYKGDMKLVGLNLNTRRLFQETGVKRHFTTFETEEEAIQEYRQAA